MTLTPSAAWPAFARASHRATKCSGRLIRNSESLRKGANPMAISATEVAPLNQPAAPIRPNQ